jgi:CRP-like cAMP-binding protein
MTTMNAESGCCYIILFSNGFIKGGKSGDIGKRYKAHKARAAALGISVKKAFYTEPHPAYHANEKRLLSALSAVSEARVGEFFRGVTEASAIEALASLGLEISSIQERRFMAFKKTFLDIAADKEMTLEPLKVWLYLMSRLDFDNFLYVTQNEVADYLGMKKPHVSRAMKLLERKALILRGPKAGHSHAWRLNPDYGYKGDPEGKVCQPDGKKAVFKVIDGGKKD